MSDEGWSRVTVPDEHPTVVQQLRALPALRMPDVVVARLERALAAERQSVHETLPNIETPESELESLIAAEYASGPRRRRRTA